MAAYLLWHYARRLASATFPQEGDVATSAPNDTTRLLAVVFVAVGMWCIVESAPTLVSGLFALWSYAPALSPSMGLDGSAAERELFVWTRRTQTWTVAAGVRLVIGLALVAGPTRLARAIQWIRLELRGSLNEDATTPPAETKEHNVSNRGHR